MTRDHAKQLLNRVFERCDYEVRSLTLKRRLIGWSAEAVLVCHGGPGYKTTTGWSHEYSTGPHWAPTLGLLVGKYAEIYLPGGDMKGAEGDD